MATPPSTTSSDSLLSGIRRHLDGLKGSRDGMVLYALIERGLKRFGETGQIERAFVNYVTTLLGRYAKDPSYNAATRIKARLIQQRLALHLASGTQTAPAAAAETKPATTPVPPAAEAPRRVPERVSASGLKAAEIARKVAEPASPPPVAAKPIFSQDAAEARPIEELEQQLVERVTETLSTESAAASTDAADIPNALNEFGDLKNILVKGLDELIRERHALIRRIEGATGYLKALEGDRRRLHDELQKARKHSSVDELTGLPKRDIFVRSLEAEVGRVRRYGFAFALALIDLDGMQEINESYGRDAGDVMLHTYAAEIFSRFRAYDLVARYGGDEFAVLFPNTQKDGAMQALEKAQKRAASTYITHDGRSLRLPTFSSVLTVYSQGEKPAQLLKRAAEALDNARTRGGGQIVVSLPSV